MKPHDVSMVVIAAVVMGFMIGYFTGEEQSAVALQPCPITMR